MTRNQLEAIVAEWIPRLGLERWEIKIAWEGWEDEAEHRDAHAFVWRARDYDQARLYLNPTDSKKWSLVEAHVIIVHELLHLATREVEFVLDMVDGYLHRDVDQAVARAHRHAVEGVVDRLAYRLVELVGIS